MSERLTTYREYVKVAYDDCDKIAEANLVDVEYSIDGSFVIVSGYPAKAVKVPDNAQHYAIHLAQLQKLELGPVITNSSWQPVDALSDRLHKVELDTVDPHDHDLVTYAGEHEITMTVLAEVGPGGGHPLVEYAGTYSALADLILTHFDDGTGDDNYLLTLIALSA